MYLTCDIHMQAGNSDMAHWVNTSTGTASCPAIYYLLALLSEFPWETNTRAAGAGKSTPQ